MTLDQFYDSTAKEIDYYIEAYRNKEENEMMKLAWQTAYLINCWSKKKVTPKRLLSRGKDLTGAPAEIVKAHFNKVKEKAGL